MKLLITGKFHIFVKQGEERREARFDYAPGMVVDSDDLPDGQTAADWIAKELAREVNSSPPPTHDADQT